MYFANITNGTLNVVLNKDQTIWLNVTGSSAGNAMPDQLKVEKLGVIQSVSVAESTPITNVINVGSDHYAIVKFTADADEDYTFKSSTSEVSGLELYKSDDLVLRGLQESSNTETDSEDSGSGTIHVIKDYSMSSGDSVYIKIKLSATTDNLTMTVTKGADVSGRGDSEDSGEETQ